MAHGRPRPRDARGVSELREPRYPGPMVRSASGAPGARNERTLPPRPPSDLPRVLSRRHRLQHAGMERGHPFDGARGLAFGALPDSRRGANPLERSGMADLHRASALPAGPRPLVATA